MQDLSPLQKVSPCALQEVMHFTYPTATTAVCFEYTEENLQLAVATATSQSRNRRSSTYRQTEKNKCIIQPPTEREWRVISGESNTEIHQDSVLNMPETFTINKKLSCAKSLQMNLNLALSTRLSVSFFFLVFYPQIEKCWLMEMEAPGVAS